MKALTSLLEDIGCTEVTTYIQSGNVIFEKRSSRARELSALISATIMKKHGFAPRVHLMTVDALEKAAAANPFQDAESDPKSLHLFFLIEQAESPELSAIRDIKAESERYSLTKDVFYLHAPDGIARSRLAANVDKLLGVGTTARNWRSVTKLLELAKKGGQ